MPFFKISLCALILEMHIPVLSKIWPELKDFMSFHKACVILEVLYNEKKPCWNVFLSGAGRADKTEGERS